MNSKDLATKYGMLSHDEIDLIQKCVLSLEPLYVAHGGAMGKQPIVEEYPITVVNIGANIGTSTCAILEANPDAFVFSIDIKAWPEERENVIACNLNPARVVRLLGSSYEMRHFPYEVDMVFVDGGHHDEAVIGDIEVWKPRCKQVMLFHDYHHPNYKDKPNVNLDEIVDREMADWQRIGEARYLVGFRR